MCSRILWCMWQPLVPCLWCNSCASWVTSACHVLCSYPCLGWTVVGGVVLLLGLGLGLRYSRSSVGNSSTGCWCVVLRSLIALLRSRVFGMSGKLRATCCVVSCHRASWGSVIRCKARDRTRKVTITAVLSKLPPGHLLHIFPVVSG